MNMRKYNKLEQSFHCTELAMRLEKLGANRYNHEFYTCGTVACALGWAAEYGFGGLFLDENNVPIRAAGQTDVMAADEVFGEGAYQNIFSYFRYNFSDVLISEETADHGWSDSINLLYAQAAMLRDQHEEEVENDKNRSSFIA
jgi:hypothetical protein